LLVAIEAQLAGGLDLSSAGIRRTLGGTLKELAAADWRKLMQAGKESSSQALGRAAVGNGASGLLVRSAAVPSGINVAVFPRVHRDDRMNVVEGAKLARLGGRLRAYHPQKCGFYCRHNYGNHDQNKEGLGQD
jgi:hypothetical protein